LSNHSFLKKKRKTEEKETYHSGRSNCTHSTNKRRTGKNKYRNFAASRTIAPTELQMDATEEKSVDVKNLSGRNNRPRKS
jgi:hypothetical protein